MPSASSLSVPENISITGGSSVQQLWCATRHGVTGWTRHVLPSALPQRRRRRQGRCLLLWQWAAKTGKDQQVPLGAKEFTLIHRCCNFCYLAFPLNWVFQGGCKSQQTHQLWDNTSTDQPCHCLLIFHFFLGSSGGRISLFPLKAED